MAAVAEKDAVAVVVEKDVAEVVVEKVVAEEEGEGEEGLVRPNAQTSIGATRANTIVYAYEKNAIHN